MELDGMREFELVIRSAITCWALLSKHKVIRVEILSELQELLVLDIQSRVDQSQNVAVLRPHD